MSRIAAVLGMVAVLAIVYVTAWRESSLREQLAGAQPLELGTYAAMLVVFAAAFVATTRRVCWERPLAVGFVAGLWLQAIVFLQPGVLAGIAAVVAAGLGLWARPTWLCRAHSLHEVSLSGR